MKKIILTLFIVTLSGLAMAQPYIAEADYSPSNPQTGDTVNVEATAEGNYINAMQFRMEGEQWNTEDCDVFFSCTREWSFNAEDSGTSIVEIRASNDEFEYSEVHQLEIEVEEDNRDDEDEWGIISSNAEHVGGGEVEMDLELDNDLPSEYTCRWSSNSGVSITDEVMDRNDDTIFEASSSFSEGSHTVWMGCLDDSGGMVTEAVSEDFTVEDDAEAFFEVEITGTNTPVVQEEVLEVDYSVENTGDEQGNQDIVLRADSGQRDVESITLSGEGVTSGTLEWETRSVDRGWYNVEVSSDDDSDNEWIYIQERDDEDEWNIVSSNAEHIGGGEVEMELELDNDLPSDYTCRWSRNSGISISDDVMDREDGKNFEASGSFGEGSHSVWMGCLDGSGSLVTDVVEESFTVDIDDEAFFDVDITGTNSPVEEDETLEVYYSVENTGDESDSQRVRLEIDGERKDSRWISLAGGSETSGTFEWETEVSDAGSYTATVKSDDSVDSHSVTVSDKDVERPEITSFTSTVNDRDVDFELRLDREASSDVTCRWSRNQDITISDDVMDRETDSRFSYSRSFDPGTFTVYAGCLDGSELITEVASTTFNVGEEPGLELRSVTASRYSVGPGESTTLRSRVENNREQSSFVQVNWRADNLDLGSATQNIPRNTERTLERERSYSQLINRGLESGECYSLSGRLRFSGDLIDSRDATQSLCLDEDDDDIDPDPESYDLDVIVLSSSGSPLGDAEVSAGGQTVFTRSNGVATIEGLEQGSYDVTASKPGYSTRVRNNVQMDRDRTISLTLDEVDGVEADFSFSPDRPLEGQSVSFNGGLSSGNIVSYEWSFDDGSTASGRTVTHTFDEPGFYRVNLEVEDSQGRTDDRTRVVQVRSEADDPEFFDLDVQVVDSETGDEIRDARVSVDGRTRTTDSRGRVNFNLEESVYSVFVSADNYRSSSRTVTLNRNRDIQVELDPREDTVDRGNIRINDVRMPASVCRGEDVTARLDLENTGDRDRAFTLSASGLSNQIDRSYSLEDGESFTRTVEFINVEGSGKERVSFSTGDDSRERTVQVRDCPETEDGDISISARPTQIRIGESVRVSGYVDNVRRGTQVTIGSDNRQRSLGSTTTDPDGRYELYVEPSRIGEQTLTAEASGREASTRIDVLPTVSVISASSRPDRVFEGDTYEVCAEIESQSSGPLVVLKEDGEEVASKYGRGEVCFDRRSSPGNYDYEVVGYARGQRSSKSTSVEVMEMDSEVRNFPDQIASVRSGSGMVRVQLYNNQREFRNYEISLEGLPRSWTSQSRKEVHLDSGERKTEYLYFTPKEEGQFTGTLRVESEGETVYTEEIDIRSGGTDREPSRWDRFKMWLRYR